MKNKMKLTTKFLIGGIILIGGAAITKIISIMKEDDVDDDAAEMNEELDEIETNFADDTINEKTDDE